MQTFQINTKKKPNKKHVICKASKLSVFLLLLMWSWHFFFFFFSGLRLSESMISVWKHVDVTDETRHKDLITKLSDHINNSDSQHATQDLVVEEVVYSP